MQKGICYQKERYKKDRASYHREHMFPFVTTAVAKRNMLQKGTLQKGKMVQKGTLNVSLRTDESNHSFIHSFIHVLTRRQNPTCHVATGYSL